MKAILHIGQVDILEPLAETWREEAHTEQFGLSAHWSKFKQTMQGFVDSPTNVLFILKDEDDALGFMGAEIFDSPLDGQMVTRERFWYVLPGHRRVGPLMLKTAFIDWSKAMGASHYMMTASMLASDKHDRVCKIYEKTMKKFETTYIQEI